MNMFEARSLVCSQDVTVDQVMQCLMGLRELEIDVYGALLEEPGTPGDVAKRVKRSRSLVQRSLQNLVGLGMASRKSIRRTRGRAFEYSPVPKEEVKKQMRKALKEWSKNVEGSIADW
jgi:predicted transcriptional regulator